MVWGYKGESVIGRSRFKPDSTVGCFEAVFLWACIGIASRCQLTLNLLPERGLHVKSYLVMVLALVTAGGLLVSGCSNEQGPAESGEKTDQLILAVGSERDEGWDPVTGWGRYGSPLFQSTLFQRDSDLNIINDLATGYEVSDDGTTWTVDIRDDVVFSDGSPLGAQDVAFTFEKTRDSGSVVDLTVLKSATASGEHTVVFELEQPHSPFLSLLASTGIVPEHAYDESYAENPVGSGPFQLVQWDKGQQLIVEKNPLYYGESPAFERITFLFLSEDAAIAGAQAGEVDIAAVPSTVAGQDFPGMRLEVMESVDNRGIMFPFVESGETTEDGRPIGNDVTADEAVRRAINLAVDREALVEGVLNGYGTPAYSVCDKMPWWNPDTVIDDADQDEAERILSEAGWEDSDGDGIRERDGLRAEFNLLYPADDQVRQALAVAVADMVEPLGIRITTEGASWELIENEMHSNAVLFGWGSYDPLEMYNLYSGVTRGEGFYNTGYYENPAVDEHMNRALAATTEEEAINHWQLAQWDGETGFSARGDAPWAWLVNLGHLYLVREDLDIGEHKIQPHGHGWPITDNIQEWEWK